MQLPKASQVPSVAWHPLVVSCEHAPPWFRGVPWHWPVVVSQKPMLQSVEGQPDVPVIVHPKRA